MTAVLQARGLGKRYRRRWALSECTLDIPAGRVVGLVGPNGAGKTTLLSLAGGLLAPTAGTIEVCGGRPGARPGAAGEGRLRRPGHAHLRPADRRRPPQARRPAQPGLGRRARARSRIAAARAATRTSRPGSCPAASAPSSP